MCWLLAVDFRLLTVLLLSALLEVLACVLVCCCFLLDGD